MTVLTLALANLVMWTGDHAFPATYAQATWPRLEPFFRLPGRIEWGRGAVQAEVRPFNDRRLLRDLTGLRQRVEAVRPRLPIGQRLVLRIAGACRLTVAVPQEVARAARTPAPGETQRRLGTESGPQGCPPAEESTV